MLVFEEWGKPEYQEKNLVKHRREPTNLNPHMVSMPGFDPRSLTLLGGESSYQCTTLAPLKIS